MKHLARRSGEPIGGLDTLEGLKNTFPPAILKADLSRSRPLGVSDHQSGYDTPQSPAGGGHKDSRFDLLKISKT